MSFLSTLPARGATPQPQIVLVLVHYFYPRSPRGERLAIGAAEHRVEVISIHAPREGSDGAPHWKARAAVSNISIHAPREGSDSANAFVQKGKWHFYPPTPRGERPQQVRDAPGGGDISIHAPREGSDSWQYMIILYLS